MKNLEFNYSPLFEKMKEKNISKNSLINEYGVSRKLLQRMKEGADTRITTLLELGKYVGLDKIEDMIDVKSVSKKT